MYRFALQLVLAFFVAFAKILESKNSIFSFAWMPNFIESKVLLDFPLLSRVY